MSHIRIGVIQSKFDGTEFAVTGLGGSDESKQQNLNGTLWTLVWNYLNPTFFLENRELVVRGLPIFTGYLEIAPKETQPIFLNALMTVPNYSAVLVPSAFSQIIHSGLYIFE